MKKTIGILLVAALVSFGTSSCKKCAVCTNDNGDETKFCSHNKEDRENFIRVNTLLGQVCTE